MVKISSAYSKTRGHWIASLATSGACPGWYSSLSNSADGARWDYGKGNPKHEEKFESVISVTEKELSEQFEDGIYPMLGPPGQSPFDQDTVGASPQVREEALRRAKDTDEVGSHRQRWIPRPKATILAQLMVSKATEGSKSRGGAVKVEMLNLFTDERKEAREIVDDPSAVLREVERAVGDISDRNNGFDQESYEDGKKERDFKVNIVKMVEQGPDNSYVDLGSIEIMK